MKKIVCDLCGESDFVKVEGMFECQVCGAKYTIEQAKTLFRDVSDTPRQSATVNEAPEDDEPVGSQVAMPKAGPAVVKKVIVAKPAATKETDQGAAKKIVSQFKKPVGGAPSPQGVKPGQGTVVKKVVVKPTTVVAKPAAQPAQKKVVRNLDTSANVGTAQMIENLFILSENAYDS